jgi:predicted amidophosphoribosyltransferase
MTPCSACARHVRHSETACPFCGAAFSAPAPRALARIGRVTRAAVFTAALAACAKHDEPKPAPVHTGSAENLDQDFNQVLGSAEPGSAAVAVSVDAAVPLDAATVDAMSDEERTRQLQKQQEAEHRRKQQQQQQQQQVQQQLQMDQHINAKPYGAPPARRRIV